MTLEIQHTDVFQWNFESYNKEYKYIVNQGGSRSSKSISILQCLIIIALRDKIKVTIVRKTLAACKSIMEDFFYLIELYGLYDREKHNKSGATYLFKNGSMFEFMGTLDIQKLKGRKRDILYCNEANEIGEDEWIQLVLRTSGQIFIDFNPSDTEHWIYDLLKDEKSILIKSTYKNNPFLSKSQVEYIENLINVDENYYKIYALGERPIASTRIYSHFKQYIDEPQFIDWCYGLDFGFSHVSALVKIMYVGSKIYVQELLYQSKLTSSDLVTRLREVIKDNKPIYCDYARPEIIEDLKRSGFNAKEAIKDVKAGINTIRSEEIYIHHESTNLLKEYKLYSWKSKGDLIYEEPIKLNDDLLDALRYGVHTHKKKKGSSEFLKFY